MQSFVVGATGIVGGYIVWHLVKSGETPLALSRAKHRSDGVIWHQGDLATPETLKLPSFETLYCTAEIGLLADALPHIYTTALKRVIAFTSTSIVTKIESEVASERELLQRLAEGERRLIATCERYNVGWTILRPTLIYAEGRDGNVSRLARLIRRFGMLPLMGSGAGLRQPVHAEDLAIGAIAAAASDAAIGKTYALPGGRRSAIVRWSVGSSTRWVSRAGSYPRRCLSGGWHLPWQSRSFRMPMWRWAPGWQRTWCSTPHRRGRFWLESAGISSPLFDQD